MIRIVLKVCLLPALICGFVAMPAQANSPLKSVPIGTWGGDHIRLSVTETGSKVEYDCGFGTIDGPLLLKKDGTFEAHGVHVYERGGPIRLGEPPPKRHPALYRGWTDGSQMHLTVILLETGKAVGDFSLGLGHPPLIEKCL